MQLYPPPRKLRQRSGSLSRGDISQLQVKADLSGYLASTVHSFAETHSLTLTAAGTEQRAVTISEGRLPDQHYELKIAADGISVVGGDPAGIAYGLTTLGQIFDQVADDIPFLVIEDGPDFAHRGVMLDISRTKVPTMATLYQLIDQLADLKYNQLQLYTEHTFAFTKHPLVWGEASPLTASEIIDLVDYCNARFIDLVPNLNSFGHFERWLVHPEYHHLAECPDGFVHPLSGQQIDRGSTLRPNRKSLSLLRELYDEYLPLFDSESFNIGGDEPWELGQGWSRSRCEEKGSTNVYIDFLSDIQKLVDARGRRMMFWSDIVLKEPASLKRLSRDLVAMNWGYEGNHPFRKECAAMAERRIPFYVCPGTSSWNSLTGRIDNMSRNNVRAAKEGLRQGAVGYLITDWGDHGHHQYLPISYPGFLQGACSAWNAKAGEVDLVDGLLAVFLDDPGTADLLVAAGEVLELAPSPIRNATIFNRSLFWSGNHEPTATRDIPEASLQACLDTFGEIRSLLHSAQAGSENQLVQDELRNGILLAEIGTRRLIAHRRGETDTTLRSDLARAIGEHERLWLARNRPGGLAESAGHLRTTFDALRPA